MLKYFVAALALLVAGSAAAQVHVRGYTRSDGTYVAPHTRSSPDSSTYNNRSSTYSSLPPYSAPRSAYSAPSTSTCSGYGCAGTLSTTNGQPRTETVNGYTRRDGTYVAPHVRSRGY